LKLSELIDRYNLHDSLVENIKYLQEKRQVVLEIELCNWKQDSYRDSDPEMTLMSLLFHDVDKCEISPDSGTYDSDEILEIEVVQGSNNTDSEAIKIILRGNDDVKILQIQANDVEWIT